MFRLEARNELIKPLPAWPSRVSFTDGLVMPIRPQESEMKFIRPIE